MANVLFKRGLQNNLPSSTNIQDGAFYLTTDTNRLYVGQEDKTTHDKNLKLLNQTVQFASSINALSNGDSTYGHKGSNNWTVQEKQDHINDFFYVIDGNILATWDGTQWVQINKQNAEIYVNNAEITTSTTNNVATVNQELTFANSANSVDSSFGIEGGTNISVSTSGSNVIIAGAEYSIARAEASNNASKVTLSNNLNSSSSSFAIVGGSKVTVSTTGTGDIVISSTDTIVTAAELSLNNGDIELEINNGTATPITATLEDVGIVLDNGQWVKLGSTTAGTAGAIYSKDQVDTLINGINGMTIMGTIDTNPINNATITSLSGLSNVRVGDTYIATGEGMKATALGGSIVAGPVSNLGANGPGTRVGDMFIAKSSATPNPEVGGYIPSDSIQWYYIPAGNDSAAAYTYSTTVTTSNNAIMVESEANTELFGMQLSAGDGIAINSTVGANDNTSELISTISHATYTTTSTTAAAASHTSFSAITSITATNGHITGYSVETFSPVTYQFTDTRAATAALCIDGDVQNGTRMGTTANAGTNAITFSSNLIDNFASDTVSSNVFKITSDTIKLSASANPGEIVMNMEWGEF